MSSSSGELSSLLSAIIIECKKRDKNKDEETEEAKSQVGPCLVKQAIKRIREGPGQTRQQMMTIASLAVIVAWKAHQQKVKEVEKGRVGGG